MPIQTFFWSANCTILVCKLCLLFQTILDLWPVLILEIFSSWDIKKGQFQFLVTFFTVFFWSVNCTSGLYIITYIEHGQCFIWGFLVNIESVLLLVLVKYMLCSHFTQNYILLYFLEAKNPYFVTKNCWKSSYICVFILSKKRRNWFHKNLHNSGMVGPRKLPDPSSNHIFNALSIGV